MKNNMKEMIKSLYEAYQENPKEQTHYAAGIFLHIFTMPISSFS